MENVEEYQNNQKIIGFCLKDKDEVLNKLKSFNFVKLGKNIVNSNNIFINFNNKTYFDLHSDNVNDNKIISMKLFINKLLKIK